MRTLLAVLLAAAALAADPIPVAEITAIDLSDARSDNGWVAPVSPSLAHLASDPERRTRVSELMARIDAWAPASSDVAVVFRRLNAAALADLARSDLEAEVNWSVFASITTLSDRQAALQAAGAVALRRDGQVARTAIPDIGLTTSVEAAEVDERIRLLARKLVGRLLGTLPVR